MLLNFSRSFATSVETTRKLARILMVAYDRTYGCSSIGWLKERNRSLISIRTSNGREIECQVEDITFSQPVDTDLSIEVIQSKSQELSQDSRLLGIFRHFRDERQLFSTRDASNAVFGDKSVASLLATHDYLLRNPLFFEVETTASVGNLMFRCRTDSRVKLYQCAILSMRSKSPSFIQYLQRCSDIISNKKAVAFSERDEPFLVLMSDWCTRKEFSYSSDDVTTHAIATLLSAFPQYKVTQMGCRAFLTDIGYFRPWDNLEALKLLQFPARSDEQSALKDRNESFRHDFGDMIAFAVDDYNASEVDDAFSVEQCNDGSVWLHVHIADPASCLDLGSDLVKRAFDQGSTIYMPERIIPMIAQEGAIDTLGLKQGRANNTLTMSIKMSESANVLDMKLRLGRVNNLCQIPYDVYDQLLRDNQVHSMLEFPRDSPFYYESRSFDGQLPLFMQQRSEKYNFSNDEIQQLLLMERLMVGRAVLRNSREGAVAMTDSRPLVFLEHNQPELMVAMGSKQRMQVEPPKIYMLIEAMSQSPARQLIAESMVLAGSCMAKYAQDTMIPFVYRSQAAMDLKHWKSLGERDSVGRLSFHDSLISQAWLEPSVSSTLPLPHYAMGLDLYSHTTSPLRRVTDLLNHFQLSRHLSNSELPFDFDRLSDLVPVLTHRVQRIRKHQSRANRHWTREWLLQDPSRVFDAYVLPDSGIWVKALGMQFSMDKWNFNGQEQVGSWIRVKLSDINSSSGKPIFKQINS
jgi:hypothetical protein